MEQQQKGVQSTHTASQIMPPTWCVTWSKQRSVKGDLRRSKVLQCAVAELWEGLLNGRQSCEVRRTWNTPCLGMLSRFMLRAPSTELGTKNQSALISFTLSFPFLSLLLCCTLVSTEGCGSLACDQQDWRQLSVNLLKWEIPKGALKANTKSTWIVEMAFQKSRSACFMPMKCIVWKQITLYSCLHTVSAIQTACLQETAFWQSICLAHPLLPNIWHYCAARKKWHLRRSQG